MWLGFGPLQVVLHDFASFSRCLHHYIMPISIRSTNHNRIHTQLSPIHASRVYEP